MDSFQGRFLILAATYVLGWVAPCPGSASESASGLEITVRVFNHTRLPDSELRRAMNQATEVFQGVGVSVRWMWCGPASRQAPSDPACGRSVRPTDLLLNIVTASMSKRMGRNSKCFGYALHTENGFSRLAGVDSDRSLELERLAKVPRPIILGLFMAHELGHLLLPDNRHSDSGVMRASWSPSALRGAVGSVVGFSPRQGKLIRRNVRERMRAESRLPATRQTH